MESRLIRNVQITASSRYPGYPPWDGRLNNKDYMYWATADQNPTDQQWIQVDFLDSTTTGKHVIITGIQTQGSGYHCCKPDCWVKSLQIQTGDTIETLEFIRKEGTSVPKVILFLFSLSKWLKAIMCASGKS